MNQSTPRYLVKYIDIDIINILGHKYLYDMDIVKGHLLTHLYTVQAGLFDIALKNLGFKFFKNLRSPNLGFFIK